MRRLFVGNFEFEHRLSEPRRVLPARLARFNAELAASWLSIADDGDHVWTPGRIPDEFWEQLAARGLPRVRAESDWTRVAGEVLLVPWGWTPELFDAGRLHGWLRIAPSPAVVRRVNSRRWSAEREAAWSVGLEHAAVCGSLNDIASAILHLPVAASEWVLKAEFGMSGRERFPGRGGLRAEVAGWAARRLARDRVVFFEPWVERLDEAGILWEIPAHGPPELIGVAPMLIAEGGHYRGSWFAPPEQNVWWNDALAVTHRAAEDAQQAGYFGPFGVDAMQYRDRAGGVRVRPLQDVNARWTMGRLALGWRRHFPHVESGFWWHGPAAQCPKHFRASETLLRTSPEMIDDLPVQHVTAVVIDDRAPA